MTDWRSWDAGSPGEVSHLGTEAYVPRRPAGPFERTLAEARGHRLVIGRDMEFYDVAPAPHGRFFIGRAMSHADAESRWRGLHRSQGVLA